ncbi:hypothetical protein QBC40DRAFT_323006 [Triangularia verruculosa]|uniref:AAA+ ATPase domain-containing protein n=1 Tax=Triangularia verruculosa TaxID=2587418 RepID=A0AAN6XJZ4_9PEZI|nr:hypothetical protein QBC40DRAFT_323006 [Triangularia verruculosa]
MSSAYYFQQFNDIIGKPNPDSTEAPGIAHTESSAILTVTVTGAAENGAGKVEDSARPSPASHNSGSSVVQSKDNDPIASQIDVQMATSDSGDRANLEEQQKSWISTVKRVVQFKDLRNNERVVPVEDFTRRRPERAKSNKAKSVDGLFKEYSMVLRRILGPDLRLKDYRLEIQSRDITREQSDTSNKHTISFETQEDIKQLLDFIQNEPYLQDLVEEYDKTVARGKYREDLVWTLFRPHEMVYKTSLTEKAFPEFCGLIQSVKVSGQPGDPIELTILAGHHDGRRFGLSKISQKLRPTASESIRDINTENLPVIPMRFLSASHQAQIKARLLKRGKDYIRYSETQFSMLDYKGPVVVDKKETDKLLAAFDSSSRSGFNWSWETSQRVVVDRTVSDEVAEMDDRPDDFPVAPSVRHFLEGTRRIQLSTETPDECEARDKARIAIGNIGDGSSDKSESTSETSDVEEKHVELYDEDYIICDPYIVAFLLRNKMWAGVKVSGLREIRWRADPYEHLQMPEEKKTIIRSLVMGFSAKGSKQRRDGGLVKGHGASSQEKCTDDDGSDDSDDDFDDFIAGKGKGLIFLLHGKPGLGKTLTAESVAESTRRPLYQISTGELDTGVQGLEDQLTKMFRVGLRWGAVVLLDEADVLMTERKTTELQRNAIVAVFLRMIEYYQGMLFLTTNRLSDFDPAFYNRIHMSIEYQALSAEERGNIWRQHLTRAQKASRNRRLWNDEAYRLLGQIETNGRDIRNTTKTAFNYAQSRDEDLSITHVTTMMRNNFSSKSPEFPDILKQLEILHQSLVNQTEEQDRGEIVEK